MVGANITLTMVTLGVLMTLAAKIGEVTGQIIYMGH
jgi:hypothetical protein